MIKCWKVKAIKHITIFHGRENYLPVIVVQWRSETFEHLFLNGFPWQWPGVSVPDKTKCWADFLIAFVSLLNSSGLLQPSLWKESWGFEGTVRNNPVIKERGMYD